MYHAVDRVLGFFSSRPNWEEFLDCTKAGVLRESVEELGNAMPYILDQAEFLDCKNNGWRPAGNESRKYHA